MKQTIHYIFSHPNDTGVITFVLGILFILSLYHFLLYFQHKDKTYLFYSLYTFVIFLNHLPQSTSGFLSMLIEPHYGLNPFYPNILMWIYNILYFIFVYTFIDISTYSKKWHSFIFKTIYVFFGVMSIVVAATLITGNVRILYIADGYFVLFFLFFGLICYIPLFKYKIPLRKYIILGGLVLFTSSLMAYYFNAFGLLKEGQPYSIFYLGVVLENLIFSLALGYRQKMILESKNEAQEKLILQLKENEKLRGALQDQLEKDVLSYSQQAEAAKIDKLKANFDKEIAELKMASLRSQMNPHFIFNSLNAIKLYIIDSDKEKAIYYLNKFSKLIRKILAATREKEMSLAEEIETTKLYSDIENIRFENKIDISFDVDPNLSINTIKIPSLILQPFIENAIWHGLSPKKGSKKMTIKVESKDTTHLKITISDNGIGRKKAAKLKSKKIHKRASVGIKITEERLRNFCKDFEHSCSLKFKDLYEGDLAVGTEVILMIPLK